MGVEKKEMAPSYFSLYFMNKCNRYIYFMISFCSPELFYFLCFCQSILPIYLVHYYCLCPSFSLSFFFFFFYIHCCVYEQWIEGPILNLLDLSWSVMFTIDFLNIPFDIPWYQLWERVKSIYLCVKEKKPDALLCRFLKIGPFKISYAETILVNM